MNITEITKKCAGCAACADSCPTGALRMTLNADGFYVPVLQKEKCVGCEKCVKNCPMLSSSRVGGRRRYFYSWNKNESVRAVSSSGGIFSALAESVLAEGGVVFGASYAEDYKSVYMTSTAKSSLEALRVSKYVQSNAEGVYKEMEAALKEGKRVLFVGSPCQAAAARNILGYQWDKLTIVDFLCGGFPSSTCYAQYIEWLEQKYGAKAASVNFRDKSKTGWVSSGIRVKFENGKEYFSKPEYDYYYYYYFSNLIKNESCLSCKFRLDRYADLTIADFWGFRKMNLTHDDKGMSLIVAHNAKGMKAIEAIEDTVCSCEIEEEYGAYDFVFKERPDEEKELRFRFLEDVRRQGFVKTAKNGYFKGGKPLIILNKIKRRLLCIVKR